jgi:hypothetical protein
MAPRRYQVGQPSTLMAEGRLIRGLIAGINPVLTSQPMCLREGPFLAPAVWCSLAASSQVVSSLVTRFLVASASSDESKVVMDSMAFR